MSSEANPPEGEAQEAPLKSGAWVGSTYYAEGFPYAVVHSFVEVLFTELGASLKAIGLTSLLHLPWNLKFLWGPFLDAYGTKRSWVVGLEVAIAACLIGLAVATTSGGLVVPTLLFAALAFLSATHDIAIDAHYLVGLDEDEQAKWVGLRAPAYRAALLVVGGPGLILAGRLGFPLTFGLCAVNLAVLVVLHGLLLPRRETAIRPFSALIAPGPLLALGAVVAAGAAIAWVASPGPSAAFVEWMGTNLPGLWSVIGRVRLGQAIPMILLGGLVAAMIALPRLKGWLRRSESFYAEAFVSFLDKPRVGLILWFIVFFRTGESFLQKMKYPFFKSLWMSLETYGWVSGTVGMVAALVAPAVGGLLIARHGLRRWIWPLVIAQNALNIGYWWLAESFPNPRVPYLSVVSGLSTTLEQTVAPGSVPLHGALRAAMVVLESPPEPSGWAVAAMSGVITLEMFGAGLGTAVFMVYIMRCPLPGHRAAHTAILTALMSASFTIAGVTSGFLAEQLGFSGYFLLTVLATVPGMAVIPFLPHLDEPQTGRSG